VSAKADPVTGLVVSYRFLWPREHDRTIEHGGKARPACVVVPITQTGNIVVLFPLTTQEPSPDRLALLVPDTERRRLKLRGSGPSWIILDEGNRDIMPGSFHLEPISYDPPIHTYGQFSQAFMHQVLRTLASAIQARRLRTITRES
jgi:hypothetical protein